MSLFQKTIAICLAIGFIGAFYGQTLATIIVVDFPDENLEAAVRDELNIPTDPITVVDMETMERLSADYSDISNLQGLEYATNLRTLLLDDNNASNISPIAGLTNLTMLNLYGNNISDISPIAGLTNLTLLDLSINNISNISSVTNLTNLTALDLNGNHISDISSVTNLTNLVALRLSSNNISDISPVAGLAANLTDLTLSSNNISDISPVAGLTNLAGLALVSNNISDISPLANLTDIYYLTLDHNNVSDTSSLANLTNLECLYLRSNQIETLNLSNASFSALFSFDIGDNPLTEVLLANSKLDQNAFTAIMEGGVSTHYGIANLGGVLRLDMSGSDFSDISDFSALFTADDLEELSLSEATNLDGSEVVALIGELDSLNWLDVSGPWDSFSTSEQNALHAWDAIPGNTLVTGAVPEPTITSLLLTLIGLAILWKKQRGIH